MEGMEDLLKIIGAFFLIGTLLALAAWMSISWPRYTSCLNSEKDKAGCFSAFLVASPPIQEAKELQEACNQSDANCLLKIGQKAAEKRATDAVEESP